MFISRLVTTDCVIDKLRLSQTLLCMKYGGGSSSRFSSNSYALASELLENNEEMFPRYWFGCYHNNYASLIWAY